ncbi:SusE domain-containing protein [Pontibacter arcticus]|nr:SusE domain-containing protein [Pontibacter arcticus]
MKTIYNRLFILCFMSLFLFSCEKDEDMVVVKAGTAPALSMDASNLVLTEDKAENKAIALNWTASDFAYQAAVTYTLQLDMKGNNFAAPLETAMGSGVLKKEFTVSEFNTLINRMPVTAFRENEVEVRVKASVSDLVAPVYSNVSILNITPYLTEPPYKTLYMVGGATDAGWDNSKAIAMLRDPNDLFKFTYTGKFKADYFKFLGKRGSWAPMYGGQNNTLIFRETESDPDPASIQIATEGYKTVTVDLRNNTYTITDFDASAKATYPSIGMIGTFTEWGSDVLMTRSDFNPHYWSIEYTFKEDVQMKFRVAGDWGTNWGAPIGEEQKLFNKTGGENFQVAAGSYLIVFNDLTNNYIFVKK